MKKDKFLTVYAVLDEDTQERLKAIQDDILQMGDAGTQTMGIPFHISLGSFPVEEEETLAKKIDEISLGQKSFAVQLRAVNHFYNRVLFLEPECPQELEKLHFAFDGNYADGFPWHPHVTLFRGDIQSVERAMAVVASKFSPFFCQIVGLEMGEFFPTRWIIRKDFDK